MDSVSPDNNTPKTPEGLSDEDGARLEEILKNGNIDDPGRRIANAIDAFVRANSEALKGKSLEEKISEFANHVSTKGEASDLDVDAIQSVGKLGLFVKKSFTSSSSAAPDATTSQAAPDSGGSESAPRGQAAPDAGSKPAEEKQKPNPLGPELTQEQLSMLAKQAMQQQAAQQQMQPGSSMGGAFRYLREAFNFKGRREAAEQRTQVQQSAARLDMQSWLDSRATSDQKLDEVVDLTRNYAANAKTATPEQLDQMKTKLDGSIGELQRAVDFESRKVLDEVQSKRMGVGEAQEQMTERVKKINEKMDKLLNSDEVEQNPDLKARLADANEKMNNELKKVIENLMEMLKRIFSPKNKNAPAPN
jgi:division protein CdvB (Snf7/Vps24/ESCRT-III family)